MQRTIFSVALVAAAIAGETAVWAQGTGAALQARPGSLQSGKEGVVSGDYARNLKLMSTATVRFDADAELQSGQYRIDDVNNLSCPASPAGNCVVTATVSVQLAGSSANNLAHLCVTIDNKVINPPACPYVGTISSNATYATFSFPFAKYAVRPGVHKLQSRVGFDATTFVGNVHIQYDVYK